MSHESIVAMSSRPFHLLSHSLLGSPSHLPLGWHLLSSLPSLPYHSPDSASGAGPVSPELLQVGEEGLRSLFGPRPAHRVEWVKGWRIRVCAFGKLLSMGLQLGLVVRVCLEELGTPSPPFLRETKLCSAISCCPASRCLILPPSSDELRQQQGLRVCQASDGVWDYLGHSDSWVFPLGPGLVG